ncbi:hypothetical protein Emag_004670 [Eimeria magna]
MPLFTRGLGGPRSLARLMFCCLMLNQTCPEISASDAPLSPSPNSFSPIPTGFPLPDDVTEAEVLAALSPGQVVPFRAIRGGGGLDGSRMRPGDVVPPARLFAMFMDDMSSLVRKAWSVLWLPHIKRALASAEEKSASVSDAREAQRVSVRERARMFAHLNQLSQYFVNDVIQRYKLLQNKVYFKYFTDHVNKAVEFSLLYSLMLLANPVRPVGELAHLAYDEDKPDLADVSDTEAQILTPDGRLIPAPPNFLQRP